LSVCFVFTFAGLVENIIAAVEKKERLSHGLINFKDTKIKCRLYWCLIEFYGLEIQSVLVFSTQLCELLPL
jgi:hypothetical protein